MTVTLPGFDILFLKKINPQSLNVLFGALFPILNCSSKFYLEKEVLMPGKIKTLM